MFLLIKTKQMMYVVGIAFYTCEGLIKRVKLFLKKTHTPNRYIFNNFYGRNRNRQEQDVWDLKKKAS